MAAVLGYVPESITAKVGDMVTFVFMQKNHTATQSTFAEPCKKKEGGMDSGFMPNPEGKAGVTWNMTVETEEALCTSPSPPTTKKQPQLTRIAGFYCKQQNGIHCGKGMVFSINAATTGDKTMADFKNLAIGKNGTGLMNSPIQNVDPAAAAVASPVTVLAGEGAAAATGTGTGAAAGAVATVIAGQGTTGQGQSCTCSCLCGMNSFPAQAAINNFGGFAGMLS
jgi:hypothetical protein